MKYAEIKKCDIANGPGVRISLFVSGCIHHCKNCFNSIAWDFDYGKEFTQDTINEILKDLSNYYISGLTILGGEPMEPSNQEGILPLLQQVREKYPEKSIWIYTGYLLDDLLPDGKVHTNITDEILKYTDTLVDGPFVEELKDISLVFKGSSNQRIIDIKSYPKIIYEAIEQ